MNKDQRKSKRLWERPREPLGGTDRPGLTDHIGTDELIEFLLPHLFGTRFPKEDLLPQPDVFAEGSFLVDALATGRLLIACDQILRALRSGQLMLLAADMLPSGEWGARLRIGMSDIERLHGVDVKPEFLVGQGSAPVSAFPNWVGAKTFFLKVDDVEDWLLGLEPLAHLPANVVRESRLLPDTYVHATPAICWLAGQPLRDWVALFEQQTEIESTIDQLHAYENDETSVADYRTAAKDLCEQLAAKHMRVHAANELLRAMAEDRLSAWGKQTGNIPASQHEGLEKIPQEAFVVQRVFAVHEDTLTIDDRDDMTEYIVARNAPTWKHVRFLKADLVRVWGNPESTGVSEIDETFEATTEAPKKSNLPARQPKKMQAKARLQKLIDAWETGQHHPRRDEFVTHFRENFCLSRDEARELWRRTPKAWRKRGRPTGKAAKKGGEI